MRSRLTALGVARLVALAVLVLVVFGNAFGHFHTDIKPEVYVAPGRMLEQYLSSWSSTPYLGAANFNVGLVPVLLWTALLRLIGLSPEMTFKVFHLVLWVIGASGAGRLLRELLPRVSPWSAFATSVVFLANPDQISALTVLGETWWYLGWEQLPPMMGEVLERNVAAFEQYQARPPHEMSSGITAFADIWDLLEELP